MRFFCKCLDLRKFPLPKIDEASKESSIHQGNSGKCSKFTNKALLHAPRFVNSGKHAQKRPKMYVAEVEMHVMKAENVCYGGGDAYHEAGSACYGGGDACQGAGTA